MFPIKLRTKPVFRILHILKINRIMQLCNLFIERPSYLPPGTQAVDREVPCVPARRSWIASVGRLEANSDGH